MIQHEIFIEVWQSTKYFYRPIFALFLPQSTFRLVNEMWMLCVCFQGPTWMTWRLNSILYTVKWRSRSQRKPTSPSNIICEWNEGWTWWFCCELSCLLDKKRHCIAKILLKNTSINNSELFPAWDLSAGPFPAEWSHTNPNFLKTCKGNRVKTRIVGLSREENEIQ